VILAPGVHLELVKALLRGFARGFLMGARGRNRRRQYSLEQQGCKKISWKCSADGVQGFERIEIGAYDPIVCPLSVLPSFGNGREVI